MTVRGREAGHGGWRWLLLGQLPVPMNGQAAWTPRESLAHRSEQGDLDLGPLTCLVCSDQTGHREGEAAHRPTPGHAGWHLSGPRRKRLGEAGGSAENGLESWIETGSSGGSSGRLNNWRSWRVDSTKKLGRVSEVS